MGGTPPTGGTAAAAPGLKDRSGTNASLLTSWPSGEKTLAQATAAETAKVALATSAVSESPARKEEDCGLAIAG